MLLHHSQWSELPTPSPEAFELDWYKSLYLFPAGTYKAPFVPLGIEVHPMLSTVQNNSHLYCAPIKHPVATNFPESPFTVSFLPLFK